MGCGASSDAAAEPPEKPPAAEPLEKQPADAPPGHFLPTTEAELEARGGVKDGYLGLTDTFYAMPAETEEEKAEAAAALADCAAGPVETAAVDEVFVAARERFASLDKNRNGSLDLQELEPLCVWLFDRFARTFASDEERRAAIAQQLKRFQKRAPASGEWTFKQFEQYYRSTLADAEAYQLKRNEAYASGYDKSAAAEKFAELDSNSSQYLEGEEVEVFAKFVFLSFRKEGTEISEDALKAEAAKLIKRLDGNRGDNDGKISFAEFDTYFNAKIQEIERFKATAEERETRREQQSAARIQAAARGKAGRQRVATMKEGDLKEGEVAPAQAPELEPSDEPEATPQS